MTAIAAGVAGLGTRTRVAYGLAAVVGSLVAVTALLYLAGGTHTVLPHLYYVPIMIAASVFGFRGGVAAAAAATVLCGPFMPLDVAAGTSQQTVSWLSRGAFFVIVGSFAGEMLRLRRRSYHRQLTDHFEREMSLGGARPAPRDPAVEARVREVLRSRLYHAVFQPIYSLADGRLLAVEALTRFTHARDESPAVLFAQATSVGLGRELELATLEAAFVESQELPEGVGLSVNCSPSTLTDDRFRQLVARFPERAVVVEVTEHDAVEDYAHLARAVQELRAIGIRLAVDDVGAGISSLRHIVRLEPDIIKLDISLTQHLRDDPVRSALADCLVQFADRTGSLLVAEGIEEPGDLSLWAEMGATAAQGYLLGRPGNLPVPGASDAVHAHVDPGDRRDRSGVA